MQLKTLQYKIDSGWSEPLPGAMDTAQTAVIFFATTETGDIEQPLKELNETFPSSHIIGCSTAGEIFQAELSDYSVSVAIIRFSATNIRSACVRLTDTANIELACRKLAEDLHADDLRGIFLLSEGLNVNATQVLSGIAEITSNNIVVTGGLAGDGKRFSNTWVYGNGKAASDTLCAIAFYGDSIHIGHGSKGGWDIFGPDRMITRAEENVLYELDGQPALALYKKYLGDRATGLPATGLLFPLAINKSPEDRQNEVVRTILSINEDNQSITFASDIPQGYYARLMRANLERLIGGAYDCEAISRWNAAGQHPVRVAVNISTHQIMFGDIAADINSALTETGVDPELLELEITESALMQYEERAVSALNKIESMGVKFAIDDFGTGYASMEYLKKFPVDRLKIDHLFVKGLSHDMMDKAIVRSIITLAHRITIPVVAEGVETEEQLQILNKMFCNEIQGFTIALECLLTLLQKCLLRKEFSLPNMELSQGTSPG